MGWNLTIDETKEMNMKQIAAELGKRSTHLEKMGMEHKAVCEFVSSIMNLGIASQDKWKEK